MRSFQIISGTFFFSVLAAAGPLRRDTAGNFLARSVPFSNFTTSAISSSNSGEASALDGGGITTIIPVNTPKPTTMTSIELSSTTSASQKQPSPASSTISPLPSPNSSSVSSTSAQSTVSSSSLSSQSPSSSFASTTKISLGSSSASFTGSSILSTSSKESTLVGSSTKLTNSSLPTGSGLSSSANGVTSTARGNFTQGTSQISLATTVTVPTSLPTTTSEQASITKTPLSSKLESTSRDSSPSSTADGSVSEQPSSNFSIPTTKVSPSSSTVLTKAPENPSPIPEFTNPNTLVSVSKETLKSDTRTRVSTSVISSVSATTQETSQAPSTIILSSKAPSASGKPLESSSSSAQVATENPAPQVSTTIIPSSSSISRFTLTNTDVLLLPTTTPTSSAIQPSTVPQMSSILTFSFIVPSNIPKASASSGVQPAPTQVPTSSAQPSQMTTSPPVALPTILPLPAPTSLTPDDVKENLAAAQGFNQIFASLTASSPCTPGAIACVNSNVGNCDASRKFVLSPCDTGSSCYALPMTDTQGVYVGCANNESAKKILGDAAGPTSTGGSILPIPSVTSIASTSKSQGGEIPSSPSSVQPSSSGAFQTTFVISLPQPTSVPTLAVPSPSAPSQQPAPTSINNPQPSQVVTVTVPALASFTSIAPPPAQPTTILAPNKETVTIRETITVTQAKETVKETVTATITVTAKGGSPAGPEPIRITIVPGLRGI
ncbi:hypothetical protein HYALB_00010177 [Hymenoscyphus albidus]|uniref:Carbohydrate-binding module family 19 domain-containing protein n=1 Tax=Hymenoscyphus albidus TaxID=595503 RepID=A0A9N9Q1A8_9HELO|nr:hypothetical protein HYALB_00010177 [Hymenoscyphus albidus]